MDGKTKYKPTKAEKEEEMDFSHLEGMTPEEMADPVMQEVDVTLISRPEKRPRSAHYRQ